jgi:hypothetical protein
VSASYSMTMGRPLRLGEGKDPVLDLEDHASIETSRNGQGEFDPLIDIGNGKVVPKERIL